MFAVGIPMGPEVAQAIGQHTTALRGGLAPWAARRTYLNFADRPTDAERAFPPDQYRRLQEIKAQYDPDDVCCASHPVPAC